MTRVALLWHMHQPFYEDLVTGEHILPWVRLHALKDYFGMAALLREFPRVRATFNLVPSLLVQIEAFAENRARDHHLELGLKPAAALTEPEGAFVVEHFFHAHREHMIGAFSRYAELFHRRGSDSGSPEHWRAVAARFSPDDLRDLQVLHKLAWVDPMYREHDSRVQALAAKGTGFAEEDKAVLREVELEILGKVIPEYREAASRGQVELSTSPFYHPILPLLCDTDVYLATHPASPMPRRRFQHPEDADAQLRRAIACHRRLFGQSPAGLWPSEGSVSNAMVPLAAAAGFGWMASDELVLSRTLGVELRRDDQGHLVEPEILYAPRAVRSGSTSIACLFRDHLLSDLIGFTYAGWPAEAAASDFCARLLEAGRRYEARTGGGEATIPIILDGENAWEHFPGGGRPFLRALYGRLERTPGLTTVTCTEACAGVRPPLDGIFPGSWIDANFYIWIGHADDRTAWTQLADARRALDQTPDASESARSKAYEEALIAEGSDWFWWYGDDHTSAQDAAFDDLFRRHLRNVYGLLGLPIPDDLFVTNISTAAASAQHVEPTVFLRPTIDGEETNYFEWLGAGVLEGREASGAMQAVSPQAAGIRRVLFGFDAERLYVRVDGARPLVELLGDGSAVTVKFLDPAGVSFTARQVSGHLAPDFEHPEAPDGRGAGSIDATLAVGSVLELAVRFAALRAQPGREVSFVVLVTDAAGVERERYPVNRPIEVRIPEVDFEARHWDA
ncbi:MAG: hypothetical protein IT176_08720 [Acidobacteria bacterium]|nr:hypothetical protein [Acidobacteriota bacterium]